MSETVNEEAPSVIAIEIPKAPEVRVRSAAVSSTVAAAHPGVCPACGCDTVLMQGQFQREFSEEMFGGQSMGETLSDECVKSITAIACPVCQIRYVVEPDDVFKLREENMELLMELSRRMGLTVEPGNSKAN